MGSGKSTIGPILANTIGYEFVDLDRMLEESEGKTVSEIFRDRGEPYFRQRERELIGMLCLRPKTVISLGGGTLCDPESFRTIMASGIVVYLKVSPDRLFGRLHRRNDRPMLSDAHGERLSDSELQERISLLYQAREPFYARADITVLTDEKRVGTTVDAIVKLLSESLR
jgi:shikimate kinase